MGRGRRGSNIRSQPVAAPVKRTVQAAESGRGRGGRRGRPQVDNSNLGGGMKNGRYSFSRNQAPVLTQEQKEAQTEAKATQAKSRVERDIITNDIKSGAGFVQSQILGEEGLGRLKDDAEVQETLQRFKGISETGLSSEESLAEREKAFSQIDQATQTSLRGLQARLASSGVKGATAGQQLIQRDVSGAQQKANVARDLFLQGESVKREGLKDFSSRLGQVKTFDLAQAASEKSLKLQGGTLFAQLGSSSRSAQFQAQEAGKAQVQSAAASKPSGGGGITVICTAFKDRGLISPEVYSRCKQYGKETYKKDQENGTHHFKSYNFFIGKVVALMDNNKVADYLGVRLFKPFVRQVSGDSNFLGKIMTETVRAVCSSLYYFTDAYKDSKVNNTVYSK